MATCRSVTTPATFDTFQVELSRLVRKFELEFGAVTSPSYTEAQVRQDYLDPLIRALGWDLENSAGVVQKQRQVEIESRTDIAGRAKRADYLFRTDGRDRFICEAKRPREGLGPPHAFQAKRYAWNKNVAIALLTDFEELKIYVVGGRPHIDTPDVGLWKAYHYREYPVVAGDLWKLLACEHVTSGSIDAVLESIPTRATSGRAGARQLYLIKPDRTRALDTDFLEFLDEARRELASDLLHNNDHAHLFEGNLINDAVQTILDRLLFIRICEDRDIDTGPRLQSIVARWRREWDGVEAGEHRQGSLGQHRPLFEATGRASSTKRPAPRGESLWATIVRHVRGLDRRPPSQAPFFNGNLFKPHFSEDLLIGDGWLEGFIGDLSAEESPYLFNVIPVEILGSVYERFLGKVVRPQGRGVTIEEKPAVRKAGGVYYTPRYVVDFTVEQALGRRLDAVADAKTFAAFEKGTRSIRILDPACGSGSFLIGAFERLCEHWQRRFTRNPNERKKELCWVDRSTQDVHLTVDLKRTILRGNIYGVDIDPQAVEVTQLSLYLKMLEGEDHVTLQRQRELFGSDVPLLPPLQDNIKCGNSLVGAGYSLDPVDLVRINAFDWEVQFDEILKTGGFKVVLGNPPWGAELEAQVLKYLSDRHARVVQRMIDSYIYFTDQALRLAPTGTVGFVIPSTVLNQVDAQPLRHELLNAGLACVVNLGKDIFTKKVLNTTTIVVTAGGEQPKDILIGDLSRVALEEREAALARVERRDAKEWLEYVRGDPSTTFFANIDAGTAVLLRLRSACKTFGDYLVAGIARGVSPDIAEPHVVSDDASDLECLERSVLRRSISGKRVKRYNPAEPDQWLIYTHKGLNPKSFPNALARLRARRDENTCKEVKEGKHPWWALHRARDPEIFASPKLIGLTTSKSIEVVFDENRNLVVTDAMYLCKLREGVSPKAVLGVLHSKLFAFLYRLSNQGESRVIPQIKAAKLEPLPFPDLTQRGDVRADKLVALVDRMLVLTPKMNGDMRAQARAVLDNAASAIERQIDELVYDLYGLTSGERALVEAGEKSAV